MTHTNSQKGIVDVLLKLDEDDLMSLAKTVTQGLKKSSSKEEAINNIIKYSLDELSILRRKAVTREVLFSYLDERNIIVRLPTTKNELIDRIVELWSIPRVSSSNQIQNFNSENSLVQNSCQSATTEVATSTKNGDNISVLAEQFAKWFYSMLNGSDSVGAEHFFPDASLKLNLYTNGDCDTTIVENDPEEISSSFVRIKLQYNLYFNLNVSTEGVQGRMDPHGLVLVLACGTLHIQNNCAGVFEQVFALARDPYCENNWKIKTTELNLRSKGGVIGPPSLCDSDLTSELLMLPSD